MESGVDSGVLLQTAEEVKVASEAVRAMFNGSEYIQEGYFRMLRKLLERDEQISRSQHLEHVRVELDETQVKLVRAALSDVVEEGINPQLARQSQEVLRAFDSVAQDSA